MTKYPLKVVGVSFRQYAIKQVYKKLQVGHSKKSIKVELVREPTNQHDTSAIQVRLNGEQVGYLSKDIATELAPDIDNGLKLECELDFISDIDNEHTNHGVGILVWEKSND